MDEGNLFNPAGSWVCISHSHQAPRTQHTAKPLNRCSVFLDQEACKPCLSSTSAEDLGQIQSLKPQWDTDETQLWEAQMKERMP